MPFLIPVLSNRATKCAPCLWFTYNAGIFATLSKEMSTVMTPDLCSSLLHRGAIILWVLRVWSHSCSLTWGKESCLEGPWGIDRILCVASMENTVIVLCDLKRSETGSCVKMAVIHLKIIPVLTEFVTWFITNTTLSPSEYNCYDLSTTTNQKPKPKIKPNQNKN